MIVSPTNPIGNHSSLSTLILPSIANQIHMFLHFLVRLYQHAPLFHHPIDPGTCAFDQSLQDMDAPLELSE